jgi:hypothetical protein
MTQRNLVRDRVQAAQARERERWSASDKLADEEPRPAREVQAAALLERLEREEPLSRLDRLRAELYRDADKLPPAVWKKLDAEGYGVARGRSAAWTLVQGGLCIRWHCCCQHPSGSLNMLHDYNRTGCDRCGARRPAVPSGCRLE